VEQIKKRCPQKSVNMGYKKKRSAILPLIIFIFLVLIVTFIITGVWQLIETIAAAVVL